MNQSEEIKDLAAALAKAQGQMENASKDSTNPHFKSKYADLASVWDACRKALSENGLSVIQPAGGGPETVTVTTRLMHTSGQWIEESITMKPMQMTPQGIGSTVTYCRRYALASMVGVAPDEDDDGNAASQPSPQSYEKRQPQPQPTPITKNQRSDEAKDKQQVILRTMNKAGMKIDEIMEICGFRKLGFETLGDVLDIDLLKDGYNRLDFHIKEVKQA